MARPQFADRVRWLTCNECQGRSFSDPEKAYHWPSCSRYRGWRFGPSRFTVPEHHISVIAVCSHRADGDWAACATCTDAADFDSGGEE